MTDGSLEDAQQLLREADALLLQCQWVKAAQKYWAAATVLEKLKELATQSLVTGYYYLATALYFYFDEGQESAAIKPLRDSIDAFRKAAQVDRVEFATGLLFTVQAEIAGDNDEFRTGRRLLRLGARHLNNALSRCADLGPACRFWLCWGKLKFYYYWIIDLACDEESELALELLEKVEALVRDLTSMAVDSVSAGMLYGSFETSAAGIIELSQAMEASDDDHHKEADAFLQRAKTTIARGRQSLMKADPKGPLSSVVGSVEFFAVLVEATEAMIRARAVVFTGDRVSAIRTMKDCMSRFEHHQATCRQSKSSLEDWKGEVDEIVDEMRDYMDTISKGDPGLMDLEGDLRKTVSPELLPTLLGDLHELSNAFMNQSWMAVIVLSGAVLEGLLITVVLPRFGEADGWREAPRRRNGDLRPLDEWDLGGLIAFAERCGILRAGEIHISNVLREYRNFIHPGKRSREGLTLGVQDAEAAVASLKVAIRRLAR